MEILTNQAIEIIKGDLIGNFRVGGMDDHFVYLCIIDLEKSPFPINKRGLKPKNGNNSFENTTNIIPIRHKQIAELVEKNFLVDAEYKFRLSNRALSDNELHKDMIDENEKIMELCLSTTKRLEYLSRDHDLAGLFNEIKKTHGCSKTRIYDLYYKLVRHGFSRDSLIPDFHMCGGRNQPRTADDGKKKPGKKSAAHKYAILNGLEPPPEYGMTSEWKEKILRSWKRFNGAQLSFEELYINIIKDEFNPEIKNLQLTKDGLKFAKIPSRPQVRYCINNNVDKIVLLQAKTTPRHFKMTKSARLGVSFEGRPYPGHTYAIDSTILDIYLLNSTRTHIIGRPVLYLLVDVFSGAIVGFYLTLHGQNWESVKVALFNTLYNPLKMASILGMDRYLNPFSFCPGVPIIIMTDRGEYLSKGALHTCQILQVEQNIVEAYRGDLKGIIEVQFHHIKSEYYFTPGTHFSPREELELRRSNPLNAKYTLYEYAKIIYSKIYQYNLTANISWRMTDEMHSMGVKNHPAALWNWGFESGLAPREYTPEDKLIQTLLPQYNASVNENGIILNGRFYADQDNEMDVRLATLSNRNTQKIDIWTHPANIQNVWTTQGMEYGMRSIPQNHKDSSYVSEDEYEDLKFHRTLKEDGENLDKLAIKVEGNEYRQDVTDTAIKASNAVHAVTPLSNKDMKEHRNAEKTHSVVPIANESINLDATPNPPVKTESAAPKPKSNFDDFLKNVLGDHDD